MLAFRDRVMLKRGTKVDDLLVSSTFILLAVMHVDEHIDLLWPPSRKLRLFFFGVATAW